MDDFIKVEFGKMVVEIKKSDVGYIIDVFDRKTNDLIDTITVWDDDLRG